MNLRPNLRAFLALSGMVAALGSAHCGSASESLATGGGTPTSTSATPPTKEMPQESGDFKAGADAGTGAANIPPPPATPPVLDDGLLLVNATTTFPAFRVCPPEGEGKLSTSPTKPVPTSLMPRSSLAGVDINGATRIDPQPEFAAVSDVVVLAIDDTTKQNPALANGTCRALACTLSGGNCMAPTKLFRVPVRDGQGAAMPGAFNSRGRILALRETGGLHFEVLTIQSVSSTGASQLRVDYRNLSTFTGEVRYFREQTGPGEVIPEDGQKLISLNRDYSIARFTANTHVASLLDIQQDSDPRVPIDSFYLSPGSFALLLVGQVAPTDPDRGLRFLAVPINTRPGIADAGTD